MNCKYCQEQILESLADGAPHLAPEVAAHQNSCAACSEFHAAQRTLFHSLDAGLRSLVNQPVPPSLLPAVRHRLDAQPVPSTFRIPNLGFALFAAVAILSLGVAYLLRRPASTVDSPEASPIVSRSLDNSQPAAHSHLVPPGIVLKSKVKHAVPPPPSLAAPDTEVIVLAEERQAFARFVERIPDETDVALALTRPAPVVSDVPIEIALLQIETLAVKPLDPTARE